MANKGDLTIPDASSLTVFSNGEGNDIDADLFNGNYSALLSQSITVANVITDQMPQTGVASSYTAEQDFGAGIKTDTIKESTTNADVVLSTDGTGLVKYDNTDAASEALKEVANKGYVQSVAFVAGNVPAGGTAGTWLEGDGSWSDPVTLTRLQGVTRWTQPSGNFTAANGGWYQIDQGATVTCPTPVAGLEFRIKPKIGQDLASSSATVARAGSESIANDAANFTCDLNGIYHFVSDGTDWDVAFSEIGRN